MTLLSICFKQACRKDRRGGEDYTQVEKKGKEVNSGLRGEHVGFGCFLSVMLSAQHVSPVTGMQPRVKPPMQIFLVSLLI